MADVYQSVETRTVGFFEPLKNSIKGVFFGIIIFVLAFPLLWYGERRTNLGEVVQSAQQIDLTTAQTGMDGKPIKGEALLNAATPANDPTFLEKGRFLFLERTPEMYSWVEEKETKTEKSGNTEKKTTTYKYDKKWTSSPQDSSTFNNKSGLYRNGKMTNTPAKFWAEGVTMGKFEIDIQKGRLMGTRDVDVASDQWVKGDGMFPVGKYLYFRKGADSNPSMGDERIKYEGWALPEAGQQVAIAGSISGSRIGPMKYDETESFMPIFPGTTVELIAELKSEHQMVTWIIRLVGFIMLWAGLSAMVGPFTTALEYIPLIGGFGSSIIHMILGVIAFLLWVSTIIIAKFFIVVVLLGGLIVAGLLFAIIKGLGAGAGAGRSAPVMATASAGNYAPPPPPPGSFPPPPPPPPPPGS